MPKVTLMNPKVNSSKYYAYWEKPLPEVPEVLNLKPGPESDTLGVNQNSAMYY